MLARQEAAMKTALLVLLLGVALTAQTTEGVVVDAVTGAPLAGAYVSVYGSNSVVVRTDAAGHFALPSAAMPLPLQIGRAGYLDVMNFSPKKGAEISIPMTPEAVISGKLEDEDGFPVADAQLSLERAGPAGAKSYVPMRGLNRSNDLGEYRLGGLPAGRYRLHVMTGNAGNWDSRYVSQYRGGTVEPKDENAIEVKAGEHAASIDIKLVKFEGVTVSGRVDGIPSPYVKNSRVPMTRIQMQSQDQVLGYSVLLPTAGSGTFTLPHVVPGQYKLTAQVGNGNPQAGDLLGEATLEVSNTNISGLVLTLNEVKAIDIPGKIVVDGGGTPGPTLIALRGGMSGGVSVHSEPDGSFLLKGLLPGHYDIQVLPDYPRVSTPAEAAAAVAAALSPTSAQLSDKEVLRKGFDLDTKPPGPMTITLGKPIVITGKIFDAAGHPLSGAGVYLKAEQDAGGGSTDAEGNLRAVLRFPGTYKVIVASDPSSLSDQDYLKAHENDLPVITIVKGENPPLFLRWPGK
jgi:protocatechuate 3,4-dioxygenase beta subunit